MRDMDADMFDMFGADKEVFKICEMGYGASYIRDGKIYACGGVYPMWSGVGQCWMIAAKDYKKYKLNIARYMREVIEVAGNQFGFKRIQGTVRANHHEAVKFLEWMKFKKEGTLRRYGYNGQDHIMYSRVTDVI